MASGPGPCCPSGRRLSCFSSTELKKQVESAELKNQRLKEVFQTKIQEFRKACYTLTGYQVDITREGQYRLTSMYAEHKDDCLVFKVGPGGGPRPRSARPLLPRAPPAATAPGAWPHGNSAAVTLGSATRRWGCCSALPLGLGLGRGSAASEALAGSSGRGAWRRRVFLRGGLWLLGVAVWRQSCPLWSGGPRSSAPAHASARRLG